MNFPPLPDCLTHVIVDGPDGRDMVAQLRVPLVVPADARNYARAYARAVLDAVELELRRVDGPIWADEVPDAIRKLRDSL